MTKNISTNEKARSINMSKKYYGTFAEIGAGQEIARWFFKVGGASGSIAKAISAYDMTFSDDIYGPEPSGRYVVESRVDRMLGYEYDLLETRLQAEHHAENCLFAIANTVAAKSPRYRGDCHGWVGLKFQTSPQAEPSEVVLHIRLLDPSNRQQQMNLGVFGVNLMYAAFNHHNNISDFLDHLLDGELEESIQVNTMRLNGPAFKETDIYDANLELLARGLSPALLICANGNVSHLDEELFKKEVLIHRAAFNPMTSSDLDMLKSARDYFCGSKTEGECAPFLLSEIFASKSDLNENKQSLLHKIRMLLLAKQNVLITNIRETFALNDYLELFSKEHINYVYPAKKLVDLFETSEYTTFESITRIFKEKTRMYFYPTPMGNNYTKYAKKADGKYLTLNNFKVSDKNNHLFHHLYEQKYIEDIKEHHCQAELLISDKDLQQKIQNNEDWQSYVPENIAAYIKQHKLFM